MITSCYPRSDLDNSGIFLRYLARSLAKQELAEQGLDIHILAPADAVARPPVMDQGVTVHQFRYLPHRMQRLAYGSGILPNLQRNKWLALQIPFFILGQFIALLYHCRKLQPDILHAHWILPQGFLAILAGKIFSIPVITTAHGGDAFALRGGFNGRLKRWVIHHSVCWTANSRSTADAVDSLVTPPVIIPMGVDTTVFHPGVDDVESMQPVNGTQIILFVGRLVEKKGVHYLLEAFARLSAKRQSTTRLYIAGDGLLKEGLIAQTHILGIDQQVEFLGDIPNRQLPALYCAADLFVAPSIKDEQGDTEGLGVMLLEAMACGTAVIASTIGGITEVVQHKKTGLLVPPANIAALSTTMEQMLANKDMCHDLKHCALQLIHQHYEWRKISVEFSSLYNKLTEKS